MNNYSHILIVSPAEVLNFLPIDGHPRTKQFGDYTVDMSNRRYRVFKQSTRCVYCGIEGQYMALDHTKNQPTAGYHFNLYGLNGVLMTIDHILAKAHGGTNSFDNLIPACYPCNKMKGSSITFGRKHILAEFRYLYIQKVQQLILHHQTYRDHYRKLRYKTV